MIYLFGSNGMLGSYVYSVLKNGHDIKCITRKEFDILNDDWDKLFRLFDHITHNDVIINCAGSIPQKNKNNDIDKYVRINTLFPHKLEHMKIIYGCNVILISTDCVFDGVSGQYDENSKQYTKDIYGITKYLGESSKCTVIRTSIIGEEPDPYNLLQWVISNKDNTINGYDNVYWNGVTCLTLATFIKNMIDSNVYWSGVKHLYSNTVVSKYELCKLINEIYNLNVTINKTNIEYDKNMTLSSKYKDMETKHIKEQIIDMFKYNLYNRKFI